MKLSVSLIIIFFFVLISCSKDETSPMTTIECDSPNITYANSAKAILDQNCATSGCHNAAAANNSLGSLANYDDALVFTHLSKLVDAINHDGARAMPENAAKLDQCDIDKLTTWISNGLPE